MTAWRVGIGAGGGLGVERVQHHGGITIPKPYAAYDAGVSGPDNISKLDRLRLRDGGRCWLCDEPFDFNAKPNSPSSPTIEHLLSQSLGGPDRLDNLVLCHPRCNRILANRPIAEKVRLRDRRRKKRWLATLKCEGMPIR